MLKALLLLFASLKFGSILLSAGSMLLTIWIYATIYGFSFAVGFIAMILIHEMGHYLAARRKGLNVGLPTFIPFVGAMINLKDVPLDAETEAYIAYAGPFVGTLAAFAAYFLSAAGRQRIADCDSYAGFMNNLFNLIRSHHWMAEGSHQIHTPRFWFLGAPMLVALFFWHPSPLLILIAIFAVPSLIAAWRYDPNSHEARAYRDVPANIRGRVCHMYLGLACTSRRDGEQRLCGAAVLGRLRSHSAVSR